MSMTSSVSISDISTGNFDDADEELMLMTLAEIWEEHKHVEIDDGTITIAELLMRARRMKRKYDVGLIVIDYIQLIIGDKSWFRDLVQEAD